MLKLEHGAVLAGRYRLDGVLGGGGYGVVFEAWDQDVGRHVALKIPRSRDGDGVDDEMRERFRREAAAVARLQDPHTVTLFDYGEADGHLYMVFEYVDGTPLSDFIEERGPLPIEPTVRIAQQILSSLREAHANGILHRDLKPENVIVYEYMGDEFRAKLVDFGLAKQTETYEKTLTQEGMVMGTAQYVSPEAYLLRPLSPASDLFGLGMVLYEMVVGEPANQEDTPIEIAERTCNPKEFEVPASVPEPLRTVIMRMIRKQPPERYQSAEDVLRDLRDIDFSPQQPQQPQQPHQPQRSGTSAGVNDSGVGYAPTLDPNDGVPAIQGPPSDPTPMYGRRSPDQSSPGSGSGREFSADDFEGAAAIGPEITVDESALKRPAPRSEPEHPHPPRTRPRAQPQKKGGVLGFTVLLLVVLVAASAGIIWALDIQMPWMKEEPVDPATLPPRAFNVTVPDTAFFWVDWQRGVVFAESPNDIPATGRCALILNSRAEPAPPGVYYVVDGVDSLSEVVEVAPIGREELARRAEQCDEAGSVANSVVLSAEILASESKLADVERRAELRAKRRKRAMKQAEKATQKKAKVRKVLDNASQMKRMFDVIGKMR